MTRGFAKAMVNLYGIAFVLGGVAAAFHTKAVIGALVLLFAGVQLLRRRVSGVSVVMALAVLAGALGLLFAGMASWLALSEGAGRAVQVLLPMALGLALFSLPTIRGFTRPAVARQFGVERIRLIEPTNREELRRAGRGLLCMALALVAVVALGVLLFTRC